MTSELWNDLRGLEKVRAILADRQAREAKKRYNPNARRAGETKERHAQRILFQDQRAFKFQQHSHIDNCFFFFFQEKISTSQLSFQDDQVPER